MFNKGDKVHVKIEFDGEVEYISTHNPEMYHVTNTDKTRTLRVQESDLTLILPEEPARGNVVKIIHDDGSDNVYVHQPYGWALISRIQGNVYSGHLSWEEVLSPNCEIKVL